MAKKKIVTTKEELRAEMLKGGARNLRDFGYPDCTESNIMGVMIFREFFKSMLESTKGKGGMYDEVADELLSEINNKKKQSI